MVKFQDQVKHLRSIKGRHTGLVSVLIPSERKVNDVVAYLRNELTESANIQDKTNRKNVLASISRILE